MSDDLRRTAMSQRKAQQKKSVEEVVGEHMPEDLIKQVGDILWKLKGAQLGIFIARHEKAQTAEVKLQYLREYLDAVVSAGFALRKLATHAANIRQFILDDLEERYDTEK